jgi:ketosteroid isomerase-like protein
MRAAIVIVFALLWSTPPLAQGTDDKLRSELEALHAKWFKGFDSGDGATMDQLERDDLMLVLPEGGLIRKTRARAGKQPTRDPQTARTLSDVSVRRFGDTAVLTAILTTKSAKENSKMATTVVFVQSSGTWKVASAQWTPVTTAK